MRKTYGRYQRVAGKSMSSKWDTATQFIVTVQKDTKAMILFYPEETTHHNTSGVSDITYVITRSDDETGYGISSYQMSTMETVSKNMFEYKFKPGHTYHLLSASRTLTGNFGAVLYFESTRTKLNLATAERYDFALAIDDEWEGESAGGNLFGSPQFFKNPLINFKLKEDEEIDENSIVNIMLEQHSSNVAVNLFDVIPGDYFIGFFIINSANENLANSGPWMNYREITKNFKLSELGNEFDIVPCTQNAGEFGGFSIYVKSNLDFEIS